MNGEETNDLVVKHHIGLYQLLGIGLGTERILVGALDGVFGEDADAEAGTVGPGATRHIIMVPVPHFFEYGNGGFEVLGVFAFEEFLQAQYVGLAAVDRSQHLVSVARAAALYFVGFVPTAHVPGQHAEGVGCFGHFEMGFVPAEDEAGLGDAGEEE